MIKREQKLRMRIDAMDTINSGVISRGFRSIEVGDWDSISPWDEFLEGTNIHLGKRSGGWKFIWNWNSGKYYKTKEELFKFIRDGRVVDEYGEQIDVEEFITMALDWGKDDGWDIETYYKDHPEHQMPIGRDVYEEYIDGLRVSTSVDFS
jgi:hypothetical protein